MACPVHGGDNPHGFGIRGGTWRCFTHHCHEDWGGNLVGLVRALKGLSYDEAVRALEGLLTNPVTNKRTLQRALEDDYVMLQIEPDILRQSIEIPCPYFLERGFSADILKKYDVGLCTNPNKEMYNRTVVPIFSDDYRWIVGCTGRSILEKCKICGYCHDGYCPTKHDFSLIRWKHNRGFRSSYHLFNLWFAKKRILESGRIILTEGPCDCIKLAEAGIDNAVALFGVDLKRHQEILLQQLGVRTVILALDPDPAGEKSKRRLKDKLSNFYTVEEPKLECDPGKMSVKELKRTFKGDVS